MGPSVPDIIADSVAEQPECTTHKALRVLDLPEMLEHILLFLPAKDIYKAMRVSQNFKTLVTGSIELRRHMFIEQVPWNGPDPETSDSRGHDQDTQPEDSQPYQIVELNPILFGSGNISFNNEFLETESRKSAHWKCYGEKTSIRLDYRFGMKTMRQYTSFSRQVLTQPAVPGMKVILWDPKEYVLRRDSGMNKFKAEITTIADCLEAEDNMREKMRKDSGPGGPPLRFGEPAWRSIFPPGIKFLLQGKEWLAVRKQ